MSDRAYIVYNPAAGMSDAAEMIQQATREAGFEPHMRHTQGAGDATRITREFLDAGAGRVLAYGGDGTINEVADALRDSDAALGIIPGGTANVMAYELDVPLDVAQAVRVALTSSRRHHVDMATVNDQSFILRVACGWEAQITLKADQGLKDAAGNLAYMIATVKGWLGASPARYRLTLDDTTHEIEATGVSICNSGNIGFGDTLFAPGIRVDDGLLDVVVLEDRSLRTIMDFLRNMTTTTLPVHLDETLTHYQGQRIRVEPLDAVGVICDGEAMTETSMLDIAVQPSALTVILKEDDS